MSEQLTISCPNCGYSKELPRHAVPPEGTRAACPKCARKFPLSPQTMLRREAPAPAAVPPAIRRDATLTVNVKFQTCTARDNRFAGKGVFRVKADRIEITGRRRRLFAFRSLTEQYSLSSVRNVTRLGKAISFVLPLDKGCWQALLVCHDEATAERLEARLPKLRDPSYSSLRAAHRELKERVAQLQGGAPAMWTILALNCLIYLVIAMSGKSWTALDVSRLRAFGGNFSPFTTGGEWWRMLSATFLHSGLLHLVPNMFALYIFGRLTERIYGTWAFVGIYLLSGLAGSAGTLLASPDAVSVGASGAIFGVIGAVVVFLATDRQFLTEGARKRLLTALVIYGTYTLVSGFRKSGIDNAAHIGGVLAGLILGWMTETPPRLQGEKTGWITGSVASGIVLVLLGTGIAVAMAPRPGPEYQTLVKMIELTKEIGAREKALAAEGKKISEKGTVVTKAEVEQFTQRLIKTYEDFDDRLNALTPTTRGLKARHALMGKYIALKKEAGLLFDLGVDQDNKALFNEAHGKAAEAKKIAEELSKPVERCR